MSWRASLAVLGLLLMAGFAGLLAAGRFAKGKLVTAYPAPGRLVDVGGRRLHLDCRGEGPVTILLEAGLGESSLHWHRVLPGLATLTRTCAYDRAGLGFSDPSSLSPTLAQATADLDALLAAARIEGPLLLVGHSYGGLLVRAFRARRPEQVVGLVLVDATSEHQDSRIIGYGGLVEDLASQLRLLAMVADSGLFALMPEQLPRGHLDEARGAVYRAQLAAGPFFEAASAEAQTLLENLVAFRAMREPPFGRLPLVVVSRGRPEPLSGLTASENRLYEQVWSELQVGMSELSEAGRRVIAKTSGHAVNLEAPELVVEATAGLLETR